MSTALQNVQDDIFSCEPRFNAINVYKLNFKKEANFALQLLGKNEKLLETASMNPASLENAIANLAAIGISLNPATKEAYLVPRDGEVCLDISAIGMIKLATDSGSIRWGQAKLAHKNDKYKNNGVGKEPTHEYEPFGDRGPVIGVYVVVKTSDNDFLSGEMTIQDCQAIRDRSTAWKAFKNGKIKSTPWSTDEGEMMKKTVIKREQKYWPKSERLSKAVEVLNQHEGIDFKNDKQLPHMNEATDKETPLDKKHSQIRADLAVINRQEKNILDAVSKQSGGQIFEKVEDFDDAQAEAALYIIAGVKKQMAGNK